MTKQSIKLFRSAVELVLVVLAVEQFSFSQSSPPPDLDLAYRSATEFWKLIVQKKRLEASKFLSSDEQRSAFLSWQEPPYFEPVIGQFRFGAEPNRVVISTSVRVMGPGGQAFDRHVEQEWIYKGKRWLFNLDISQSMLFSSKSVPSENEKLVRQFKDGFRIKTQEIEIPRDAFGKTSEGTIEYEYSGPSGLSPDYVDGPGFLVVELSDLKHLANEGKIHFTVVGQQLLSNEDIPPLKLSVESGLAREEFLIPVRWTGHPPYRWTFSPPIIDPSYKGEVQLEIFNQSDETWNPGAASSTKGSLEMVKVSSSGSVRPGESVTYTFTTAAPSPETPRQDSVVAYLNGPQPTLTIPVPYLKPETKTEPSAPPPRETLDRLIRDNRLVPPNKVP